VWREWREHRTTLLTLACALPLLAVGVSRVLARRTLDDALVQNSFVLAFVVIALVAVGGELLGVDRRGNGLRWLERLPSGLGAAFCSKLVTLLVTSVLAAGLGLGTIRAIGLVRGAQADFSELELLEYAPAVLAVVLWTFACSAWALRGGVALLASAAVLGFVWFPLIHLVTREGLRLTDGELRTGVALACVTALTAAWCAFARGGRLGRGTGWPTLFVWLNALPMLGLSSYWAVDAVRERDRLDPMDEDFRLLETTVTDDGRVAFVAAQDELSRWSGEFNPVHWVRVDLERGTHEILGQHLASGFLWRESTGGLYEQHLLVIEQVESESPLAFELKSGQAVTWSDEAGVDNDVRWRGLGQYLRGQRRADDVIVDPFRARQFAGSLVSAGEELLVRPGRWLCMPAGEWDWSWLDPETGERTPTEWAGEPLVLFADGRILLAHRELGLQLIHPERGEARTLDTCGVPLESIWSNSNGARVPNDAGSLDDAKDSIVLRTFDEAWLVLDADATTVRRIDVPGWVRFLRLMDSGAAIGQDGHGDRLVRVDLDTGAVSPVWPVGRPD
jgi:hypothetical protein